jgi:hypothetical protein
MGRRGKAVQIEDSSQPECFIKKGLATFLHFEEDFLDVSHAKAEVMVHILLVYGQLRFHVSQQVEIRF